jgi:MFS family permease
VTAAAAASTTAPAEQSRWHAFASLRIRPFRWWFVAQILSGSGGMAQGVAQGYLIWQLTQKNAFETGFLVTAAMGPVLLASAYAGVLLDRLDVRKTLVGTQIAAGSFALVLGVLVSTGDVQVWMVFVLAVLNGFVFAIDQPARQLYVVDLVGRDRLSSAIGLYEVIINASRVIGPAVGGAMLAVASLSACFYINAISFVPPLVVLLAFRPEHVDRVAKPAKVGAWTALREGLHYVRHSTAICSCLVMAGAAGMVFSLGAPLLALASRTFHFGGSGYGALMSCFGLGAIPGGFAAAATKGEGLGRKVRMLCLLTGLAVLALALTPERWSAFPLIALVGFFSIWMIALANTLVQVRSDPALRGRVMGLWTMVLPGLAPISVPLSSAVSQYLGPRAGYGLAGVALAAASAVGWRALRD